MIKWDPANPYALESRCKLCGWVFYGDTTFAEMVEQWAKHFKPGSHINCEVVRDA